MRGNVQLGMLLGERGMISLTKEGGQALLGAAGGAYCVEIEDFAPKANIFAVGVVGAGEQIRIGDEVVVAHRKEVGSRKWEVGSGKSEVTTELPTSDIKPPTYEWDVRAVGVAQMSGREMNEAERGMAVKVRH